MVIMYKSIIEISTKPNSAVDITEKVKQIAKESEIKDGLFHIFIPGTTAGLMLNENEKMLMQDFKRFFDTIDDKRQYNHPENAFSHLRANLISIEKTIPIVDGELILGTWQSILLWEFDTKSRKRKLMINIINGEEIENKGDEDEDDDEDYI